MQSLFDSSMTPDRKQEAWSYSPNMERIQTPHHFDFASVRQFCQFIQELCEEDTDRVEIEVDMSQTVSIDSAGVGALVNGLRHATLVGQNFILRNVNDSILSVLTCTSLAEVFEIQVSDHSTNRRARAIARRFKPSNPLIVFLYWLHKPLKRSSILYPIYLILHFFYPAIDISPNITLHPSVRNPLKRLIDIVGSTIGLVVTALIFVPIAIAIALESEGNILFGQYRCGLLSRPFRMWKFRSMVSNAEALKHRVTNQIHTGESGDKFFKNANDPRITRIGRFLRRTSLDEFPQFWNVFIGEMSLVGTRPPTFAEIGSYELNESYMEEGYTEWNRLDVKPGITGVWQVNGRSSIRNFQEVVHLDLEYRKNWSIGYDLTIIWKTICVLLDRNNRAV